MKASIATLAIVLLLLALPGAQARRGHGAQGHMYDPKTVETVTGEVVTVEGGTANGGGGGGGVHLALRTAAGTTLSVRLGPASYVDRQPMKIAAGDRIEVKGSRLAIDGKPVIIAAEVRKGSEKVILRDDAGIPAWSGGRRGPRP